MKKRTKSTRDAALLATCSALSSCLLGCSQPESAAPSCEPAAALAECLPRVVSHADGDPCPAPEASPLLTSTSVRTSFVVTNDGYRVCETVPAPTYVRAVDGVGTEHVGEWVATHVHDYWEITDEILAPLEAPEHVTQVLFDASRYADGDDADESMIFLDSADIATLEVVAAPASVPSYRDSLRSTGICIGAGLLSGNAPHPILFVDRGNLDPRDHLRENGFGLFAWDFVQMATNACGELAAYGARGSENADHVIWGRTVSLTTSGRFGANHDQAKVVEVAGGFEDIRPQCNVVDAAAGEENMVIAGVAGRFEVAVLHLEQGSVPSLAPGALLDVGDALGRVGSSGLSQYPHIHVALLWDDTTGPSGRAWGVPVEQCDGFALSQLGATVDPFDFAVPTIDTWIAPAPFCSNGLPCAH